MQAKGDKLQHVCASRVKALSSTQNAHTPRHASARCLTHVHV